jgi:hypothetical protein
MSHTSKKLFQVALALALMVPTCFLLLVFGAVLQVANGFLILIAVAFFVLFYLGSGYLINLADPD